MSVCLSRRQTADGSKGGKGGGEGERKEGQEGRKEGGREGGKQKGGRRRDKVGQHNPKGNVIFLSPPTSTSLLSYLLSSPRFCSSYFYFYFFLIPSSFLYTLPKTVNCEEFYFYCISFFKLSYSYFSPPPNDAYEY